MKAQTADESPIFGRPAARVIQQSLRSVIAFVGSDRRFMVGGMLLILYILIALTGPSISPHDLNAPNLDVRLGAPTATHWLGTDRIGRDVLTRIIAGSQVSLQVAAGAVSDGADDWARRSVLWAATSGGKIDALVQRVMEGIMAFPSLVLALALVALAGPSVIMLWFAIAFSSIPRYARLVRSGVLTQKEREYVRRSSGHGTKLPCVSWLSRFCRTSWHPSRYN